jgi:hypothetical protein
MKTIRLLLTLPLFLGLMAVLFQGCYTQLATMHDEELSYQQEDTSYQQEEQPASNQSYDNNYYDDYDYWHSRSYIGFSYYYPSWRTSWGWDGCIYPAYWDSWWSPMAYPYYGYSPYYSSWYSYPAYGYYSTPYGYTYNTRQYATRNSGYQRGGNARRDGVVRSSTSGSTETGAIYDGRAGSVRGNITIPNAISTGTRQGGTSPATVRSSRSGAVAPGQSSGRVSTGRSSRGTSQPSVRQSRTQSGSTPRIGRSRGATVQRGNSSRSSGGSSGQSSRSNTPAPSYTPPPQRTSPPPSAPAPRSSGGEQRGGDSGRSRR